MMVDDLFAYARNTDPETSHEAADSIADLTARQREVLYVMSKYRVGKVADHVLVEDHVLRTEQSPQSIRSRRAELVKAGLVDRAELVKAGLVEHTGDYVKTVSGRRARVWAVTDKGREMLR